MARVWRMLMALAAPLAIVAGSAAQSPAYDVDALWPKPLPSRWILGSVTGVAVDASDRVWLVHRGRASLNARTEMGLGTEPPSAELCCLAAPQVLAFDRDGALVRQWGGPGQGYDWPQSPGSLAVDAEGNVWITAVGAPEPAGRGGARGGGAGRGGAPAAPPAPTPQDAHVLKFSNDGKFLMQIGKPRVGPTTGPADLDRPSAVAVDTAAGEVYVADTGNRRVAVFDAKTGTLKRQWAANGEPFRSLSCIDIAKDGQVYVCDREGNRVQVFQKNGVFVKEAVVAKETRGNGAAWDVAFSNDATQRTLYLADGQNQKIWVLQRDTLAVTGSFGRGGRLPGGFFGVGSIAVDSRGVVYTGETFEGKRIQKFTVR